MVGGNRASDCGPAFLDGFNGSSGGRVLQHDAQAGEGRVDLEEVRNEVVLCVQDVDVLVAK